MGARHNIVSDIFHAPKYVSMMSMIEDMKVADIYDTSISIPPVKLAVKL